MPHTIRLREPWIHTPIAGGTRHTRSFNWLAELQPGQRVWLVIEAEGLAGVSLNGTKLAGHFARLEIAALLALRNSLVIEQSSADATLGEVRIEIEDPNPTASRDALRQSLADADAGRTRPMKGATEPLGTSQ